MATFTWYLQGSSATEIEDTDKLQFANGTFDGKITVDEYNDSTHVKTSIGGDKSASNTPVNVKFISASGGGGGASQADWGDGTEDLDAITTAEATLKITFSDASEVAVEDAIYFAYKTGEATTVGPDDVDFECAEVGDTNFTVAEGSGNALELADQATPATSHHYYIAVSCSPTAVGTKSFKQRIELTYY